MAQIDDGAVTGTAVLFLGVTPTASVEVHVPAGQPSNGPTDSPAPNFQSAAVPGAINSGSKASLFGNYVGVRFATPA